MDVKVIMNQIAKDQIRKFGYALRGMPPRCHSLLRRGKRISCIAAISTDGSVGIRSTT